MGDDGGGKWEGEVRSIDARLLLYSAKDCKSTGSEIRKLRFKDKGLKFKDSHCTFGAGVRKTAGAGSCCIPELLALKEFNCVHTTLCL